MLARQHHGWADDHALLYIGFGTAEARLGTGTPFSMLGNRRMTTVVS